MKPCPKSVNVYTRLCLKHFKCTPQFINNKVYCDFVISLDDKFRKSMKIDKNRCLNIREEKDYEGYLELLAINNKE